MSQTIPEPLPLPELPCPGCGFLIHGPEAYGSYGICPLCNWEDCPVQLANPLDEGGPNRESLVIYQRRAIQRWPLDIRVTIDDGDEYRRDSKWRPLSEAEIAFYASETDTGQRCTFKGIYSINDCYWIKSPIRTSRGRTE